MNEKKKEVWPTNSELWDIYIKVEDLMKNVYNLPIQYLVDSSIHKNKIILNVACTENELPFCIIYYKKRDYIKIISDFPLMLTE